MMVIADETDEAAMAKWNHYRDGADVGALAWMFDQAGADTQASEHSTAKAMVLPEGAINFNMGTLVGSYATVARMLDEAADVAGTKGDHVDVRRFSDWSWSSSANASNR